MDYDAYGCRFVGEMLITSRDLVEVTPGQFYLAPAGGSWGFANVRNCPGLQSRSVINGEFGVWRVHPNHHQSWFTAAPTFNMWIQIRWDYQGTWRYARIDVDRANVYRQRLWGGYEGEQPVVTTTTTTAPPPPPPTTVPPPPSCDPSCCC